MTEYKVRRTKTETYEAYIEAKDEDEAESMAWNLKEDEWTETTDERFFDEIEVQEA